MIIEKIRRIILYKNLSKKSPKTDEKQYNPNI